MKVNVISESAFTVQGHGVHSAFTDSIDSLREYTDCDVQPNTSRSADVVHIHTVGPYSLRMLLMSGGVKIVSAHVMPESFIGSLIGARYWKGLATIYLRWFYNRADDVLAVSGEVVDDLAKMGIRKPVHLVPNTINTKKFVTTDELRMDARRKLKINEDAFVIVGNGQVQPRKRIDSFVVAAEEVSDAMFIWVGGIPFKKLAADSGAMDRIMRKHPTNVVFTGQVPRDEVVTYFHAADLFFFPSTQETFGLSIVEAAAAGLPILLRDLEVYSRQFDGGYEKGTDDTFSNIIKRFKTDRDYLNRWKKASRLIADRYDTRAGAARLMDVYKEVLGARRGQLGKKTEA